MDVRYPKLNRKLSCASLFHDALFPTINRGEPHISIDELKKVISTLEEALKFSQEVKSNEIQFKIARDACIQRFEYCIELSWKVSIKKLGSQIKFPKQAIREIARADLITSAEEWLDFIEARNNSSHSYDENIVAKVFKQILSFRIQVQDLLSRLQKLP